MTTHRTHASTRDYTLKIFNERLLLIINIIISHSTNIGTAQKVLSHALVWDTQLGRVLLSSPHVLMPFIQQNTKEIQICMKFV